MGNKNIMNVKIVTLRVVWLHSKQTLRITFPHSVLASSPVTKGVRRTVAVSPSGHVVFCKGREFSCTVSETFLFCLGYLRINHHKVTNRILKRPRMTMKKNDSQRPHEG